MKCPYCEKDMLEGKIVSKSSCQMRWMPKDKETFLGLWVSGGLKLGCPIPLKHSEVTAHHCSYCNKIIIETDI